MNEELVKYLCSHYTTVSWMTDCVSSPWILAEGIGLSVLRTLLAVSFFFFGMRGFINEYSSYKAEGRSFPKFKHLIFEKKDKESIGQAPRLYQLRMLFVYFLMSFLGAGFCLQILFYLFE